MSGISLVETLVVVGLFSAILLIIILMQKGGFNAFQKTQVHGDTYRMAMLTAEHLKRELQYVQVTQCDVPGKLKYKAPKYVNGQMYVNASGCIEWDTEVTLSLEPDNKGSMTLIRSQQGTPLRNLCSLGNGGEILFSMPQDKILEVSISARVTDPTAKIKESDYRLTTKFYLPNQEI
ncbi:MAG: hypothetical protein RDV48_11925 [Candidatus Eremiobacteraeota bacterium]|nr:hypothetical protein [Candidatus Eremiobacteraeota bacterium]